MTIPARISIVTIGVADVARSARFYEALGWERCSSSMDEIVWLRTADSYLGIFGWHDLAEDAKVAEFAISVRIGPPNGIAISGRCKPVTAPSGG